MEFDLLFYIGRFSPFHKGHRSTVEFGLTKSKRVCILTGSANVLNHKNPFNYMDRWRMIGAEFDYSPEVLTNLLEDFPENDKEWASRVERVIGVYQQFSHNKNVGILGYNKDDTSYYLKLFPQYPLVESQKFLDVSATDIRHEIYTKIKNKEPLPENWLLQYCSPKVVKIIKEMIRKQDKDLFNFSEEYWKEKTNAL